MTGERKLEHEGRVVRQDVRSAASCSTIWEAWTDPQRLSQWFTRAATGEPRVGASYTWEFEGFDFKATSEVVAVDPGKRLLLAPAGRPGLLEIWTLAQGGGSRFGIAQSGAEETESVESGWRLALALLREYAEHHFGRSKETTIRIRPTRAGYERVRPYFTETSGLAKWLLEVGRISKPGSPYQWTLQGGLPLSGRVLSDSGLEVSLYSREFDGVVELKTFDQPDGKGHALAVRLITWNPGSSALAEYGRAFDAALDRLTERLSKES